MEPPLRPLHPRWKLGPTLMRSACPLLALSLLASGVGHSTGPASSPIPTGQWSSLDELLGQPFARSMAGLAFDPTGGLGLLFGGRDAGGHLLGDTWVNDGDVPGHWADFSDHNLTMPPPLVGPAISWDAADQYFVMFGGSDANGASYGHTWTFLNFNWTDVTANQTASPPPAAQPAMAYDSADGEVLLIDPATMGTTWTFHAGLWNPMTTVPTPPPRIGALALDDPEAHGAVFFGGSDPTTGAPLNDTWVFSGGKWSGGPLAPSPPASGAGVGAFDPRSDDLVLFVGDYHETWGYQNGTWGEATGPGAAGPNVRTGESMYYDSIVAYDILFGGISLLNETVYAAWGWNVPAPYTDPTLASVAVSPSTWAAAALVVIIPVLFALWWRRPPRPSAVTAPASSSAPA